MSSEVLDILVDCGQDVTGARVSPLPGGVSSETALVDISGQLLVVKRALGQLNVSEEWTSAPERIIAEAAGLDWFHRLTPDHVPSPLGVSPKHFGLVLPHAPSPCPDLRRVLLDDPTRAPAGVGRVLGNIANIWHAASPEAAHGGELDDRVRVTELRLDPFYRDMATRWPTYSGVIGDLVDELESATQCVVHGDFTPKNVLCLPDDSVWVIDTEVTHIGHPVLDTASMLAHLTIKTLLHRGLDTWHSVEAIRREFLDTVSDQPASVPPSLAAHVGLLMAVRVAGRARVPYLSPETTLSVENYARELLHGAPLESLELS